MTEAMTPDANPHTAKIEVEYDPAKQDVYVGPRRRLTAAWEPLLAILCGCTVGSISVLAGLQLLAVERGIWSAVLVGVFVCPAFVGLATYAMIGAWKLADDREAKARAEQ